MNFFSILSLFGGLALFLYGMSMLGTALEKVSGGKLESILEKLTNNIFKSVLLGALVTAAIQSSSATTVIVVGLVNARIMKLRQAIGVIMGANIGTTITAHILRLSNMDSPNFIMQLLKPSTLTPAFAVLGILMFMVSKKPRIKELGQGFIGFAILFTGMFAMEAAVSPLAESETFVRLFSTLSNPILGVLAGALVTAVIQSSSASVGILQALSSTGIISFSAAFPIIMGQNIGTCITPILSSIGASKNAKRTAAVHLSFNIIGTVLFLIATYAIQYTIGFPFWNSAIDKGGIANFHTVFNVVVTLFFIPFAGLLEKLVCFLVKDDGDEIDQDDILQTLDERFLVSPALALSKSREVVVKMGQLARDNYKIAVRQLHKLNAKEIEKFHEAENVIDRLEDHLNSYLLKISQQDMAEPENRSLSEMLHVMSEFERIGDYAMNIIESAQRLHGDGDSFSVSAQAEMDAIADAVYEIIDISVNAFEQRDADFALVIEPLEEIIDRMEETLKDRHIERLRQGKCSVEAAFPFVESLASLERIADHCSNIGVYILNHATPNANIHRHEYLVALHKGDVQHYADHYARYEEKYYTRIDS